ncbi:MAG: hypothetical protein H0X28_13530 [Solirubrobacterales bacterium]|nr:hypothetical protein [Solirubrobacterales bacterium]
MQTPIEMRRHEPCLALYNVATGVVTERPQSQLADLDRPGAPVVCGALRGWLLSDRASASAGTFSYGEGLLARTLVRRREVQLKGCHGRTTTLRTGGVALNLDLRDGVLSWDTGHDATTFNVAEELPTGTLYSYRPATRRRLSWRLPSLPVRGGQAGLRGAFGYSTHTANTVFWIASERVGGPKGGIIESSAVYSVASR